MSAQHQSSSIRAHSVNHARNGTHASDEFADVIAPIAWMIPSVINLATLEALPPAAGIREVKKAADTFASTGRNVFVHYATPILSKRRELLLASGLTKKKYYKTAAQVWPTLAQDDAFYWHQAAKELRICMKQGVLNPKGCLRHAGRAADRDQHIWHAEKAVATYLSLPSPSTDATDTDDSAANGENGTAKALDSPVLEAPRDNLKSERAGINNVAFSSDKLVIGGTMPNITMKVNNRDAKSGVAGLSDEIEKINLLDTLPDRFECKPNMLYSHFAHYDYDEVRHAVGRTQTMLLRHLAERFDKTGKELFYYYVVPRLCKQTHPPSKDDTVMSKAAQIWQFMVGKEKEK